MTIKHLSAILAMILVLWGDLTMGGLVNWAVQQPSTLIVGGTLLAALIIYFISYRALKALVWWGFPSLRLPSLEELLADTDHPDTTDHL